MDAPRPGSLTRRALLGGSVATIGGAAISTGCGLLPRESLRLSTAPLRLLGAAIEQAQQVLTTLRSGEHLATLRNNHRDHLAALRRRIGEATFSESNPTPSMSIGDLSAQLVNTEHALWETARQRVLALPELHDGLDTVRHTDQLSLLGSIAACQATHLVLLKVPVPEQAQQPLTGSQRSVETLQIVLANEHAVIYGYGALGGRLHSDQRDQALTALERHRTRRDALGIAINANGATPVQSAPSYQLPRTIDTPEQARTLAITLEENCAEHWRLALAGVGGRDRSVALAALVDCATTATGWRLRNKDQPVTVPFPGT